MQQFFWFRRDLRLQDNAALYHALRSPHKVLPVFIFDTNILDKLEDKADARLSFLHKTIAELQAALQALGSTLLVRQGKPAEVWAQLLGEYPQSQAIYCNRDYEQYAKDRDEQIKKIAQAKGVDFKDFKDHVIFEKEEVLKKDGTPYTIFTPYSKVWKAKFENPFYAKAYPNEKYQGNFLAHAASPMPSLADVGFTPSDISIPPPTLPMNILQNYAEDRDYPAKSGTSRLGIHFRFGTISIRWAARQALGASPIYLNELIWRDFYSAILGHFPQVETRAFRSEYDRIEWLNDERQFEAWCAGKTGYPLVDAGMRELNATGHMHNRVRMVVASFLTKHLLIDWRWGEAYFAKKLLDFDLASNNGGWQWAAGCGTDAAPYFRIFNPLAQAEKFDPKAAYIRRWVPEFGTWEYAKPIVPHEQARERCLATYKKALG